MSMAALNVGAVHAATMFLAQPEGADPGGRGEGFGKSTPVGLLLMIVLLIAVAFLVRSMTKHLKRAQTNLRTDEDQAEADGAEQNSTVADSASTAEGDDDPAVNEATEPTKASPQDH